MVESLAHELDDMVICEGIPGLLAVFAVLDEPGRAQDAQLVRDGRLAHLQGFGDVADAHLLFDNEQGEQLDARLVAEHLEELRQAQARLVVELVGQCVLDPLGMRVIDLAERATVFILDGIVHLFRISSRIGYIVILYQFQGRTGTKIFFPV